ncbi:MAG: hypothetical protein II998_10800 [Clostridia bacterium]|nr:hypothetical protein [Clostridia bacterium]
MLKKSLSIFMVVIMLLTMSITSQVFASSNKGNALNPYESSLGTTGATITSSSFNGNAEGFAGKLAQDTVKKITLTEESGTLPIGSAGVNGGYPRYAYRSGFDFTSNPEATFQFNIYADGDTIAGFTFHYYDLIRWTPDGKLYGITTAASWATTEAVIGKLERGRWHTIAVTFDSETLEQDIYADGEFLATITRCSFAASNNTMRIGTYAGSNKGVVAIDDVYTYPGAYDPTNEIVTLAGGDERMTINSDSKTIICQEDAFADAASFNKAVEIAFDANYAVLYDFDLTVPATDFAYGVVAINSKNGIGYDYYKVYDGTVIEENFDDGAIDTSKLVIQNCEGDYTAEYIGGLGTKSADDKALVLYPADKDVKADNYNEPSLNLKDQNGFNDEIITIEADVYKNDLATTSYIYTKYWNLDKATPGQSWLNLVTFSNYGQIHIAGKDKMPYKANRWYKIAATYTREKSGFDIYVNGQFVDFVAITNNHTAVANYFQVVSRYDLSEKQIPDRQLNSKIAIDNYRVYLAPYIADGDNATITVSGDLKLSKNNIIAKDYTNYTKAQIMNMVTAPVSYEIYTDNTYTTALADDDKITADSVLVSKSSDGEAVEYYIFSEGSIGYLNFEQADGKITVSVSSTVADSTGYIFALAEYDGNELLNVSLSKELKFMQNNEHTLNYSQDKTYKAFVWAKNQAPVRFATFSE